MMRIQDTLRLATRMFRTRPARTWLTICGIGVGIAAVVILVGLGYGLQNVLLEKIVFGDALLSLNVFNKPERKIVLDNNMINEFRQLENVDDVAPLASFTAVATFGKLSGSILLNAVDTNYYDYAGIVPVAGELLGDNDSDSILLSSSVAKLFSDDPENINYSDYIGKKVSFKVFLPTNNPDEVQEVPLLKEYKIKGIIEDSASIFAYIQLSELSSHFSISNYEKVRVKVSDREYLDSVEKQIFDKGFIVNSLSKTVDQANKIFRGIQVMLAFFGGIALVVSAIGMFNTMTVTLLERTKEIGIMRTIGGSPLNIKVMFLTESVLMGFLGGIVGIAIGVGGGLGINFLLNIAATKMGGVGMALFRFPLPFLLFIAIFSAIMGYVTGLFPSKRAGSLNPLDAIRYS